MKRVNVTCISLALALVSMAWLAVGMTSAAPLESQAAVAITSLKALMSRPVGG